MSVLWGEAMKVNVTDIIRHNGASMNLELSERFDGLEAIHEDYSFKGPADFKGRLVNAGGLLKLDGRLKVDYTGKCYRCLKDISGSVDIRIDEDFISADVQPDKDSEAYTFEGNYVELDKAFTDNILLYLPMKQICSESCKGICSKCGSDLNERQCDCREGDIDPRMQVLKNFFNNG